MGNVKHTLKAILPHLQIKISQLAQRFKELDSIEFDTIDDEINPTKPGLTMGEVIKTINANSGAKL